jgi:hypothetical protein
MGKCTRPAHHNGVTAYGLGECRCEDCRAVWNVVQQRSRRRNKDKINARQKQYYYMRKQWVDDIKLESGCLHCGYKEHACALEFHHEGNKDFDVAGRKNRSWEAIIKEIEKCIILCSNCHRVEHEKERS